MEIKREREWIVFPSYRKKKTIVLKNRLEIVQELRRSRDYTISIEQEPDSKKRGSMKSNLSATLFSCNTGKSKDDIVEYKPFIILDFDKIPNVEENFKRICDDVYVLMAFISPSGTGIKALIELDFPYSENSKEMIQSYHEFSYLRAKEYFEKKYNLSLDTSGSNINRLCYLGSSYEPYLNEDCSIFETNQDWLNSLKNTPVKKSVSQKSGGGGLFNVAYNYFSQNGIFAFEEYGDWLKLGFIIYKNLGDTGFDTFNRFSQLSNKYNPSSVKSQWKAICNSYDPDRVGSEKFIVKKMLDNGYVIKQNDILIKKFQWSESDLPFIKKELDFDIIIDEISQDYFYRKGNTIERMSDPILNQIVIDIRHGYSTKISKQSIVDYITSRDNMVRRNFLKEKIESMYCDDPTEFKKMISLIDTKEPKSLFERIFTRWAMGCFVNIFESYYDEILALKSRQGLGKTTFITQYLLKPFEQWTTTSFQYDMTADQLKMLSSKMFIYDMENQSLKKGDVTMIKKITSMPTITYRKPFDRYAYELKRISSFIMDTNEDAVFNDITGGRRFLVISIDKMNIYDADGGELKKVDYEKVWGYLYHLFKTGVRPSSVDIKDIEEWREDSRLKSDLEYIIEETFVKDENSMMSYDEIRTEIMNQYIMRGMVYKEGDFNRVRIGMIMNKYGKKKDRVNGVQMMMYYVSIRQKEDNTDPFSEETFIKTNGQ